MSFESKVLEFIRVAETINRTTPVTDGKTFKDEIVYIDFKDYRYCNFENCTIVLEYGICRMSDCTFTSCKFEAKTGSPAFFVLLMDRNLRKAADLEKHK